VDFTTALANLAIKEYDYILICASNADAQSASASSNPGRLATYIDANVTGSTAKLQQGLYGSTGTIAQAKTSAIGRNHTNLEHINSVSDESLPCEVAAAELGNRMARRRLESNANRTLQPLKRVRGSADPNGDQPTDTEAQDALSNGVSLIGYTGEPCADDPALGHDALAGHERQPRPALRRHERDRHALRRGEGPAHRHPADLPVAGRTR
jgi:phage tail sheath gpL-like